MSVKGKKMTRRRGATERGEREMWRLKSVLFNAGFFCQADEVSN